ncbi:MAG: tetratricopeptide repeat protein [Armatimonadetes bacterium]|nr:tetratricopeptide repeat protein [Armatimonadota bacterium]
MAYQFMGNVQDAKEALMKIFARLGALQLELFPAWCGRLNLSRSGSLSVEVGLMIPLCIPREVLAQAADQLGIVYQSVARDTGARLLGDVTDRAQVELFVGSSVVNLRVTFAPGRDKARVARELRHHQAAEAALKTLCGLALGDLTEDSHEFTQGWLGREGASAIPGALNAGGDYVFMELLGSRLGPVLPDQLERLVREVAAGATQGARPLDRTCGRCRQRPGDLHLSHDLLGGAERICESCRQASATSKAEAAPAEIPLPVPMRQEDLRVMLTPAEAPRLMALLGEVAALISRNPPEKIRLWWKPVARHATVDGPRSAVDIWVVRLEELGSRDLALLVGHGLIQAALEAEMAEALINRLWTIDLFQMDRAAMKDDATEQARQLERKVADQACNLLGADAIARVFLKEAVLQALDRRVLPPGAYGTPEYPAGLEARLVGRKKLALPPADWEQAVVEAQRSLREAWAESPALLAVALQDAEELRRDLAEGEKAASLLEDYPGMLERRSAGVSSPAGMADDFFGGSGDLFGGSRGGDSGTFGQLSGLSDPFSVPDKRSSLEQLQAEVAADPDDPVALFVLGTEYEKVDRWEEALDCCRKAQSLDPTHADARELAEHLEDCVARAQEDEAPLPPEASWLEG